MALGTASRGPSNRPSLSFQTNPGRLRPTYRRPRRQSPGRAQWHVRLLQCRERKIGESTPPPQDGAGREAGRPRIATEMAGCRDEALVSSGEVTAATADTCG